MHLREAVANCAGVADPDAPDLLRNQPVTFHGLNNQTASSPLRILS
jgi:hypothetical protein